MQDVENLVAHLPDIHTGRGGLFGLIILMIIRQEGHS